MKIQYHSILYRTVSNNVATKTMLTRKNFRRRYILHNNLNVYITGAYFRRGLLYLGPCQTYMMELFDEIVND